MAMAMASGKVDCAVCVVVVGWLWIVPFVVFVFSSMYYFFGVDILFYYSKYIILL